MPRGFLVKRSRRPGGCYRVRPGDSTPLEDPRREEEEKPREAPQLESPLAAAWSAGNSPEAAVEEEPKPPEKPPLEEEEKPPLLPRTPLPFPLPLPSSLKRPPRPKKPKAARKLSFADEVTTSPVLGLRIKAATEGAEEGSRRLLSSRGGFVCQLCKEPYADPLALAQHRCSRIVRVEYRCPECHKVFSCPANLASHRRWHKPRPTAQAAAVQGKENSRDQHHGAGISTADSGGACCRGEASESGSAAAPPGGELFLCPYCHKAFRRQAYLRKHLGTHQVGGPSASSSSSSSSSYSPQPQQISFPCHLCGAHFPSADIRDKHRLWHAVREELLLPLGPPETHIAEQQPQPHHHQQQIFSCKHCPSTFFSSPGLTRHINKCHPSEHRQVLLLQMPLRPGC
ncbi:insulinoma-associated protein 2 [Anolis carolinensis]|uniref:insulinoma-associated protein 2 n=1 Tax=Anolis carolinensis TaxID=28377 RepID=UPI002F2B3879